MTWVRIDDRLWSHEKVARLLGRPDGLEAIGLWTLALSWVGNELTDGFVPSRQPYRLVGDDPSTAIAGLVTVGLWDEREDGWQIHDYLDRNPSREKVLAERARRTELGQRGGQARAAKVDGAQDRQSDGRYPTSRTAGSLAGPTAGAPARAQPAVQPAVQPAREPAPYPVSRNPLLPVIPVSRAREAAPTERPGVAATRRRLATIAETPAPTGSFEALAGSFVGPKP